MFEYSNIYLILGGLSLLVIIRFILFQKKLILFYTNNCSHRQTFKPEWEKIKESCPIKTIDYDCGLYPKKCSSYSITGYPTVMLTGLGIFGQTTKEYVGPRTEEQINLFCVNN